jgi:asparagine synthase (glutamine-hydrolysing)
MYAFSIWDSDSGSLIAGTDPFGKKPLYYTVGTQGFAFASELASLLAHSSVSSTIDRSAIARFFAFGYVPAPETPIAGVHKLGAGKILKYDADSRRLDVRRYWNFRIQSEPVPGTMDDWKEHLNGLLERAVARRLEADVPLGFLLSGGLDSAMIVAYAKRLDRVPDLSCFTVGFEESSYDESHAATATAAALGVRHRIETLSADLAVDIVDDVLMRIDEPLADPSLLPTMLVCRSARREVTVALSGDGADELFAGYDTFAALPLAETYKAFVPPPVHGLLRAIARRLPRRDSNLSFDFKINRALRGLGFAEPLWNAIWLAPVEVSELERLFGYEISVDDVYGPVLDHWAESSAPHRRDRSLEYYTEFYLQNDILPKIDRSSMLNSLEVRTPFLDRDIAEFCAALPYRAKHSGGTRKYLLRELAADLLPAEILRRPKKGFGIPVASWLRKMRRPSLEGAASLGLDPDYLDRAWREHKERRADHRGLLWAWTCLDRWHRGALSPRSAAGDV